jgi:hypothetical protein
MADQISGRRARTLSIEENSFIIVYNQVNMKRKYIFSCYMFYCYLVNGKKNVIFGRKNGIFWRNFHDAFWFYNFSNSTTASIILFKVVPNTNTYLLLL